MFRWILAAGLTITVLQAQPPVTVTPVSGLLPGMALTGPSDPGFLLSVQALIGPEGFPSYQPTLPYSVLVRNSTSQPIVDACVIFDVTQPNGKKSGVSLAESLGNIPPSAGARPLLAAGAQLLASVIPSYAYYSPTSRPQAAPPADRMAQLNAAASIVISLDSVLFADGTLAGPDTQNNFVRYSQQLAADRDFTAAVLSYQSGSVASLQSYLDSKAVVDLSGGLGSQLNYVRRMASHARSFQRILAKPAPKGGAAQVFAAATALANAATSFTVHK